MLSQPSVNSPWPEHFGFQHAVGFGLSSSGSSSPARPSHYAVSQWPGLTYIHTGLCLQVTHAKRGLEMGVEVPRK